MKIKVIGNSATIISNLTKTELKALTSFDDSAIILKDEKDNELFYIGVSESASGTFDKYGIVYDATDAKTGNACVTIKCGTTSEDVITHLKKLAKACIYLSDLEEMAMNKLNAINKIEADLENAIEIVSTADLEATEIYEEDESNTSENDVTNSDEIAENEEVSEND
jgi:FtsZ-binding cell division protein ZapB